MSLCATKETEGFYFGYFWSIYMTSQVFGNWIGSIIILKTSGPIFFLIMWLIMISSLFAFCYVIIPELDNEQLSNEFEKMAEESSTTLIKNTFKIAGSYRMLFMNPQLLWTGISIAFWSAMLTPIMILEQ